MKKRLRPMLDRYDASEHVEHVVHVLRTFVLFPAWTMGKVYWLMMAGAKGPFGRYMRTGLFRAAPKNEIILSGSSKEKYLVATNDKVIGERIFATKQFDFSKFESVFGLLALPPGRGTIVDIGANIGSICIPAVKRGYFAHAVAVEPEPHNFRLLTANVLINEVNDQIQCHHTALGRTDGETLSFELSATNYGDHRVRVSEKVGLYEEQDRRVIQVRSNTFDSIVGDLNPKTDVIWMDTEGYEGFVLVGASKALKSGVPLVVEFWPYAMLRAGSFELFKGALLSGPYRYFYDLDDPVEKMPVCKDAIDRLWDRLGGTRSRRFTDCLFISG